jgi:hypothetical protein
VKTIATDSNVAASAADRDSLSASPLIKPFIRLAVAVLGPILGRNPQQNPDQSRERQRNGNAAATQRQRPLPEKGRGVSLSRRSAPTAIATANINLGGRHHG